MKLGHVVELTVRPRLRPDESLRDGTLLGRALRTGGSGYQDTNNTKNPDNDP
jgi:hypothetical protein